MTAPQFIREKLLKEIGDRSNLEKSGMQFEEDRKWIDDHRDDLLKNYAETWIAVYNGQILASHRILDALVKELEKTELEGDKAVIDYITDRELNMLL